MRYVRQYPWRVSAGASSHIQARERRHAARDSGSNQAFIWYIYIYVYIYAQFNDTVMYILDTYIESVYIHIFIMSINTYIYIYICVLCVYIYIHTLCVIFIQCIHMYICIHIYICIITIQWSVVSNSAYVTSITKKWDTQP